MSGVAQLVKMGAKGVDALVDALRAGKKAAPQDEALALAQQRAALPVSQGGLGLPANNTAMDRARAMGFTDDVYHGTNADIVAFDPKMADIRRKTGTPFGTVVSSNPATASTYAGQTTNNWGDVAAYADAGNVMPLLMNKGKNLSVSAKGDNWNNLLLSKFPDAETTNDVARIALEKGKDSATIKKVLDNATWSKQNGVDARVGDTTFVFNPDLMRSRFAAFDPWRKTAAVAATMGVAAPNLLAEELRKK
jgi:hypothetical protein